jgi:magnesium chelatase family protein
VALAVVYSRARVGIEAPRVAVEVHLAQGLPSLSVVGLPEAAVKESKDRVRAAIDNARFEFPRRRITVNLAPADLPKEGGRFDLPIALGILAASGQVDDAGLPDHEWLGELALGGAIRPVTGVLPAVIAAKQAGRAIVVPAENGAEAALVPGAETRVAETLQAAYAHLNGVRWLESPTAPAQSAPEEPPPDLHAVRGQPRARRALEIAAAGGHNLLMAGPPGTGKSMLAARLPGILPPLGEAEALEVAAVWSAAGQPIHPPTWYRRPFRAPHHTVSPTALAGGGSHPRPGEVSLAHRGVLFLDEVAEFDRRALETLREPLETGRIHIARAARQADFPARFQLVVALNPPEDPGARSSAPLGPRLSTPFLDRIDLQIEVPTVSREVLRAQPDGDTAEESSAIVRARVLAARARQSERAHKPNAELAGHELETHCVLGRTEETLLIQAGERMGLSARSHHRILKLARTIADLAGAPRITSEHLAEALSYRDYERDRTNGWR